MQYPPPARVILTQRVEKIVFDTDYIWPSPYIITSPDVKREYDTEECECADWTCGFLKGLIILDLVLTIYPFKWLNVFNLRTKIRGLRG